MHTKHTSHEIDTTPEKKKARITNSDKHWFVQGQNVFENMTCISEKKSAQRNREQQ